MIPLSCNTSEETSVLVSVRGFRRHRRDQGPSARGRLVTTRIRWASICSGKEPARRYRWVSLIIGGETRDRSGTLSCKPWSMRRECSPEDSRRRCACWIRRPNVSGWWPGAGRSPGGRATRPRRSMVSAAGCSRRGSRSAASGATWRAARSRRHRATSTWSCPSGPGTMSAE